MMKSPKLLALTAACFLVVTEVSHASVIEFDFPLSVSQEVHVVDLTGVPFPGFEPVGIGSVTLDTDTNTVTWAIQYIGLTGGIVSPGAHIHGAAGPGTNAAVQISLSSGGEPAEGLLAGSTVIDDAQEADLLAGLWYVNIHTAQNPAGEIRGQIIPEPASAALVGMGTMLLLGRRRK